MSAKPFYLYRARVVAYPDGSHRGHTWLGEEWPVPNENWAPPGWEPSSEYIDRFGTTLFIWPKSGHEYKSRSGAKKRAALLESYGATVVIERSTRITWPEREREPEDAAG